MCVGFLLNFSCTKVQSKDVSPIAGNGSRLCEAVDFEKQMFNLKQKIKWKTKTQI